MTAPAAAPGSPSAFSDEPSPAEVIRGIALAVAAFTLVSVSDGLARLAIFEHSVAQVMAWRGFVGCLTVAVPLFARGAHWWTLLPNRPVPVIGRSIVHTLTSMAYYFAYREIPLADCYAVSNAAPLLMTLLAIPLLRERVGWRRWLSTGLGFLGVLIIVRPGGGGGLSLAMLVLLAGTLLLAVTRLMTRMLARHETNTVIVFWMMAVQVLGGLLYLPGWTMPSALIALALTGVGFFTGISHMLLTQAFRLGPVSAIGPYEYTLLLWGTGIGYLLFGDVPAAQVWAGSAIVIAAGLYNLHRERVRVRDARAAAAAAARAKAAAPGG